MRTIRTICVAGAAALAVAAIVGAGPVLAFSKYTKDGSDITTSTAISMADATGGLTFQKGSNGLFHTAFTVNCGAAGGASVSGGGLGTVTSMSSTSCVRVSGTCPTPITASAVNLNWSTAVSDTRVGFTSPNHPGWAFSCGGSGTTCTGDTSAALSNGSNIVLAMFDANSPPWSCNDGSAMAIAGSLVLSISGHSLQVG
jgi:hypothetical protein